MGGSLLKKATIHQVTTTLATSKNILFSGHNHLLTTGTDDSTLCLSLARVIIKLKGHQYQWLAGGHDLEIGHFVEVARLVVSNWDRKHFC